MNDREVNTCEMFKRVVTFGHDYAADFDPGSQSAGQFAQMAVVITDVEVARTGQQGGRATARSVLLDALRVKIKNIVRTAREIEGRIPGFADKIRMPANNSQTALLTTADRVLEQLKKEGVAEKFFAYEMPATFVADLEADLKTIGETKEEQNSVKTKSVENTAALKLAIDEGLKLVGQLNAAMHNKYETNPAKLSAWNSASHIERAARRGKSTPPAPTPPPTTPPNPDPSS